jgi:hypothetical protein
MGVVLFLLLLVVLVVGGFFAALAITSKRKYDKQNELIPGQSSGAPKSWAGDNSREAEIHRRLGSLVKGLRATEMPDDVRLLDARVTIEQQAVAADKLLIAIAALPKGDKRTAKIEEIGAAVEALIDTATEVQASLPPATVDGQNLDAIVAEVNASRERMSELVSAEPGVTQPSPAEVTRYTF